MKPIEIALFLLAIVLICVSGYSLSVGQTVDEIKAEWSHE